MRTISVTVGNNLNAIVKDGTNVDAGVGFNSHDLSAPYNTPAIAGGHSFGPFQLKFDADHIKVTISAGANTLGKAPETTVEVPAGAVDLAVDLQGTYNGKIDIQTIFK